MYSCITNVNILTSLLISHGIKDAVVCPGAHNAALAHNLNECGCIRCQAVTDERSAGFVALGMAIQLGRPVAVCVTSGSALLNLLPAVAEAFYQQVPLVIISADRPQAW
ncbi:MAG: thiamine pyrophosphate-binding protein, partial [Bacteroidaceae bacterium]|nr:thiamine pyrophosphate-binding protein [Bacteroidaceae bacterium]